MTVGGKVVVVTGAAHGIGAALARRFAAEGAQMVIGLDAKTNSPGFSSMGELFLLTAFVQ